MNLRTQLEELEENNLSKYACKSSKSKGRNENEEPDEFRTCFQRDRDRIVHSKALRRLMHKTQVFLAPEGDHYRTRLTHTLEVSQIARTISKALNLNEDLTEAIALGHDLGHTPFGHIGEQYLDKKHPNGFQHNVQSLRVVDCLELDYKGKNLNLTKEVRDGIVNHSGKFKPFTLEGQVVKLSDRIAYINHDIDDAVRAGVIAESDIPKEFLEGIGYTHGDRIAYFVKDIVENSDNKPEVIQSNEAKILMDGIREWMFANVYRNERVRDLQEEARIENLINELYDYFIENPEHLAREEKLLLEKDGINEVVKDHIASMTDRFAIKLYSKLFVPTGWKLEE